MIDQKNPSADVVDQLVERLSSGSQRLAQASDDLARQFEQRTKDLVDRAEAATERVVDTIDRELRTQIAELRRDIENLVARVGDIAKRAQRRRRPPRSPRRRRVRPRRARPRRSRRRRSLPRRRPRRRRSLPRRRPRRRRARPRRSRRSRTVGGDRRDERSSGPPFAGRVGVRSIIRVSPTRGVTSGHPGITRAYAARRPDLPLGRDVVRYRQVRCRGERGAGNVCTSRRDARNVHGYLTEVGGCRSRLGRHADPRHDGVFASRRMDRPSRRHRGTRAPLRCGRDRER